MARLLRAVFLLASFMVLALGASIALGRATPLPEEVAFLHLGDICELPCWIGITPGQTTFGEARKIIAKFYGQERLSSPDLAHNMPITATDSSGRQLEIALYDEPYSKASSDESQVVGAISLKPLGGIRIPLGYAINALGFPYMIFTSGVNSSETKIEQQWYQIYFPIAKPLDGNARYFDDYLPPNRPLNKIYLYMKNRDWWPDANHRWHGFVTYHYTILPMCDCGAD